MEITINSQSKKDYLLIETKATIETPEDLLEQSQIVYGEISKHDFKKVLVDERETNLLNSLIPYFDLVKNYVEKFPPEIYDLKIATVVSEENKEVAASWEAICLSRNLNYHSFTSFQDAEKWLLS